MSNLARDHRNRELAQIHIGVTALQWSDADYRAILKLKTGESSSGKLDSAGRKAFLAHLKTCGWNPGKKTYTQADKIAWYWQQLVAAGGVENGSKAALLTFVGRTTGMEVSDLKFLPVQKASTVIEALKSWVNRCKAKAKKEATQ
nr:regulatory protein GemA [uncultured Albidiferax sp.]